MWRMKLNNTNWVFMSSQKSKRPAKVVSLDIVGYQKDRIFSDHVSQKQDNIWVTQLTPCQFLQETGGHLSQCPHFIFQFMWNFTHRLMSR